MLFYFCCYIKVGTNKNPLNNKWNKQNFKAKKVKIHFWSKISNIKKTFGLKKIWSKEMDKG